MAGATLDTSAGAPGEGIIARRLKPASSFLRRHPVSVVFAGIVLVASIVSGALWGAVPEALLGWSPASVTSPATWWTAVTALIVPDAAVDTVLSVLLALTALAAAERLLGRRRLIISMVVTGMIALLFGAGAQVALADLPVVSTSVADAIVLEPTIVIAGAIVAASALAGALWRRRIRVLSFSVLGMFALYAGDADSWYRLAAAIAGLLLGIWFARGRARYPWHRSSTREIRSLLAALVAVTGLGPIAALIAGGGRGPLSLVAGDFAQVDDFLVQRCTTHYVPACDHQLALYVTRGVGPALLAIMPLVLLVLAAWGLRSGRRSAWLIAISVDAALVALSLTWSGFGDVTFPDPTGGEFLEVLLWFTSAAVVPLAMIILLVVNRSRFRVRAPRRALRTWILTVSIGFVVCVVGFLLVSTLLNRSFDVTPSPGDLLVEAVRRFIPPAFLESVGQTPYPRHGAALWVYQWVGVAFWLVVIAATLRLYRASARPETAVGESAVAYRRLLRRGGGGTLSFLGTWAGNAHWISDDEQAAVAYRVVNGVALAIGDPLSPPERMGDTLRRFADFAIGNGWIPVFYSVHDDVMPAFRAMGWHGLEVGQETVMHLPELDMVGKRWQKVRHPLNRAEREGMIAQLTTWRELSAGLSSQIIEISEQWVTDKSLPEMGFTLGGLDELRDPDVVLLLAIDGEGRLQAVTSWMPSWRDGRIHGWTLDFMRRREDAPNGVMEFLIAKAALLMKEQGAEVLSLSGAPLATRPLAAGEELPEPTAVTTFLAWLSAALEPVYGFASLFRFKSKFLPEYRTLYMTYADPVELPAIGAAVGRAYLPDASTREYLSVVRTLLGTRGAGER